MTFISLFGSAKKHPLVSGIISALVILAIVLTVGSTRQSNRLASGLRAAYTQQATAVETLDVPHSTMVLLDGCQTRDENIFNYVRHCTWSAVYFFPAQDTAHAAMLGDKIDGAIRDAFSPRPNPNSPNLADETSPLPVTELASQYQMNPTGFDQQGFLVLTGTGVDSSYYYGNKISCDFELMYHQTGSSIDGSAHWAGDTLPKNKLADSVTLASSCSSFDMPLLMTLFPAPSLTK